MQGCKNSWRHLTEVEKAGSIWEEKSEPGRCPDVPRTGAPAWTCPEGEPEVWQRDLGDTTAAGPLRTQPLGSRLNHRPQDGPIRRDLSPAQPAVFRPAQTRLSRSLILTEIFTHLRNAGGEVAMEKECSYYSPLP